MDNLNHNNFHMQSHHEQDRADFLLYHQPSPPQMYNHEFSPEPVASFSQFGGFPLEATFGSTPMYTDTASYPPLNSPEMHGQSNYSTGPSQNSSAMGSPPSMADPVVHQPAWQLEMSNHTPTIASYDNYPQGGNEYNHFHNAGMDEFAHEYNTVAKPGPYLGESTTSTRQQGSMSSRANQFPSISTFVPFPSTSTTRSLVSPVSAQGESVSASFSSPSSSRRHSQAFTPSSFASSPTERAPDMHSPTNPHTPYRQSHFFSQSSGNFVPPLQSSCRFSLSIQL